MFHVEHEESPATDRLLDRLEEATSALERVRGDLAESERLASLGTLVGLIAHEFNNLLTPVVGYTSAALAPGADENLIRKALERANEGAARAAEIAESILSLNSDGRFAVSASATKTADPESALRAALLCLARDLGRDGITLHVEPGPDELRVCMSPADLQQVLLNLVLNARKAMLPRSRGGIADGDARPGQLRFCVAATDGRARISLSDNGVGLDHEQAGHMFDPFVSGGGGAGLGLALCHELVVRSGGRIWAEGERGSGATFHVELPIVR